MHRAIRVRAGFVHTMRKSRRGEIRWKEFISISFDTRRQMTRPGNSSEVVLILVVVALEELFTRRTFTYLASTSKCATKAQPAHDARATLSAGVISIRPSQIQTTAPKVTSTIRRAGRCLVPARGGGRCTEQRARPLVVIFGDRRVVTIIERGAGGIGGSCSGVR